MDVFKVPIEDDTVVSSLTFTKTAPIPQIGGKLPFYMRVELGYGHDPLPVDAWTYGSVRDFLVLNVEIISINGVISVSDVEVNIGLDKDSKTVKEIEVTLEVDNPEKFKIETNEGFILENSEEKAKVENLPLTIGVHTFKFDKGIRLDFNKEHLVRGFLNKGKPTEREYKNKGIIHLFRLVIVGPKPNDKFLITPEPKMPELTFIVKVEGLTPDPTENTEFDWTIIVEWNRAKRKDKRTIQKKVKGSTFNVTPEFGDIILGGDILAFVTATLENQTIDAAIVEKDNVLIRGQNPSKADVKKRLETLENQIIAYKETWPNNKFMQFWTDEPRDKSEEPSTPQFGPPDGWGVMQIEVSWWETKGGMGDLDDVLWNWQKNIDTGKKIIEIKRKELIQHYKNDINDLKEKGIEAPDITQDEDKMRIGLWKYYNGGWYWKWKGGKDGEWFSPFANDPNDYANLCQQYYNQVKEGKPPEEWDP